MPHRIVNMMNIHLQPNLCTITPPRRGPSVGPRSGPKRYHPNTPALSSGTNMSLIVPPPLAMPTLPKKPETVRSAINTAIFGLKAVGIWRSVNTVKHERYSALRPKVSESGARTRGPMPSMMTKPVVAPMTMSVVVLRPSAICFIPGVNMELASGLRTAHRGVSQPSKNW